MAQLPARRSGRDVTTVDPFREFEDIYDRMGQMVNAAFMRGPYWHVVDVPWTPLADISETDDAYVIEAELPGVTKDNVNVEVNDRDVVISGEIPQQDEAGRRAAAGAERAGPGSSSSVLSSPATLIRTPSAPT